MLYTSDKEDEVDAILTIEGRCINYLTVATRQSASIIKVSGRSHSDTFKRRIGFRNTVISAQNNLPRILLLKSFSNKAMEYKL